MMKQFLTTIILLSLAMASEGVPRHVYLTWQGNTSTTMTVNYQSLETTNAGSILYDTRSGKGDPAAYRYHAIGTRHSLPGLEDGRTIHTVELFPLKPNQTYYFIAGDPAHGYTTERKFHTIADGTQNLRFVIGGDMGTGPTLPLLLRQAAQREPEFAVVGGDIAYANDRLTNYARWDAWLDAWQQHMVTPEGFTIPMVLAIGNHEVSGGTAGAPRNALFYKNYFAQDTRSFFSRKFGKNVVIYLLDSGHLVPHGAEQAQWLDAELERDAAVPYRFAAYHVPLYPAHRAYDGSGSVAGRTAWLPIFDKHRLTTAFEHHDHVFKRTKLLRNNQPDPKGTLYLGDGCWGQSARTVDSSRRWYEAKAAALQHFWLVDVSRKRVEYRAINRDGQIFDVYPPDAKGAAEADAVFSTLIQPAKRSTDPSGQ